MTFASHDRVADHDTDPVATALHDLQVEADRQMACPFELWTARVNLEAGRLADALTDTDRASFLDRATALGLYDATAEAGWTLTPTEQTCAHGLELECCPYDCGDIEN